MGEGLPNAWRDLRETRDENGVIKEEPMDSGLTWWEEKRLPLVYLRDLTDGSFVADVNGVYEDFFVRK